MATYLMIDNGKVKTIGQMANVDAFFAGMRNVYEKASKGHKTRAYLSLLGHLPPPQIRHPTTWCFQC